MKIIQLPSPLTYKSLHSDQMICKWATKRPALLEVYIMYKDILQEQQNRTSSKGQRKHAPNLWQTGFHWNLQDSLDVSLIHALISQHFETISSSV